MLTKIFLIVLGVFLLWYLFHRPESLLRHYIFEASSGPFYFLLAIGRALFFGAIIYYLAIVYGHLDRISSFSDIVEIVIERPSRLGFPALFGVSLGLVVAVFAFTNPMQQDVRNVPIRGRIMLRTWLGNRRMRIIQRIQRFLQRFTK
jgi:hypothetical protein